MALLLVAFFIVLPFAELAVIVASANAIGLGWTFALFIALSALGAVMMRREGAAVWRRLNDELAAGRMPTTQVVDGAMVLFGAALLLTPGFLTDVAGLALILPPTRAVLRPVLVRSVKRRAAAGSTFVFTRGPVVDTTASGAAPRRTLTPSARVIDVQVARPEGNGTDA